MFNDIYSGLISGKEKVALVTKYNLGGAACWKKDMETSNIWSIIKTELANTSTEK